MRSSTSRFASHLSRQIYTNDKVDAHGLTPVALKT